jgi:hypothetical protein
MAVLQVLHVIVYASCPVLKLFKLCIWHWITFVAFNSDVFILTRYHFIFRVLFYSMCISLFIGLDLCIMKKFYMLLFGTVLVWLVGWLVGSDLSVYYFTNILLESTTIHKLQSKMLLVYSTALWMCPLLFPHRKYHNVQTLIASTNRCTYCTNIRFTLSGSCMFRLVTILRECVTKQLKPHCGKSVLMILCMRMYRLC